MKFPYDDDFTSTSKGDAMEPLRKFLMDSLTESPVELEEGQFLAEAVVVYRVVNFASGGEMYDYTVTSGVSMASTLGLLDIGINIITERHIDMIQREKDGDDSDD